MRFSFRLVPVAQKPLLAALLQVHGASAEPVQPVGFWYSRSVRRPGGLRVITSPPHHCEPAASQEKSRLARSRQLGCETQGEKVIKLLCRVLTYEHFWACPEGAPPQSNWSVQFLTREACVTSTAALSLPRKTN